MAAAETDSTALILVVVLILAVMGIGFAYVQSTKKNTPLPTLYKPPVTNISGLQPQMQYNNQQNNAQTAAMIAAGIGGLFQGLGNAGIFGGNQNNDIPDFSYGWADSDSGNVPATGY